MDVTVAVATYDGPRGDMAGLAHERAIPSAEALGVPVLYLHGGTLHEARNLALNLVATEFVVFLDADDELEPGYVDAMEAGTADLRVPAVRYVTNGRPGGARVPRVAGHTHACVAGCFPYGNWACIGTAVRADLLRGAGGWHDYPLFEDWDAWVRCWKAGATVEAVPQAVYRAHVDPQSRNRAPRHADRLEAHRMIARANGLPVPA